MHRTLNGHERRKILLCTHRQRRVTPYVSGKRQVGYKVEVDVHEGDPVREVSLPCSSAPVGHDSWSYGLKAEPPLLALSLYSGVVGYRFRH